MKVSFAGLPGGKWSSIKNQFWFQSHERLLCQQMPEISLSRGWILEDAALRWLIARNTSIDSIRWSWVTHPGKEHNFGGKALECVVWRGCGCPNPGSVQDQLRWGPGQPDLVGDISTYIRGAWTRWFLRSLRPKPFYNSILWFCELGNCSDSLSSATSWSFNPDQETQRCSVTVTTAGACQHLSG